MESVTAFAPRRQEALSSVGVAPVSEAGKALAVTATYLLSEDGRKASLLAGGDGRARQQLTVNVPVNRSTRVTNLKIRPYVLRAA